MMNKTFLLVFLFLSIKNNAADEAQNQVGRKKKEIYIRSKKKLSNHYESSTNYSQVDKIFFFNEIRI